MSNLPEPSQSLRPSHRWVGVGLGILWSLALGSWPLLAAAPTAEQLEFFENKIRPVLAEHCYSCHSAKAEKVKGGLLLDTQAATLKGGDTGPAVVPGDPDKSLLIRAVRYADENLKMPPKDKKLAPEQIADLETWVKMGAPDPRTQALTVTPPPATNHWAFQPIRRPEPPRVINQRWVQTPVDAFVLAKLEERHWQPSPAADKRTLLRRVTFDLTGLPPTPAEVETFLADRSPDAFAKVVDRLLASPAYGERWARHWLDVARYADTKGYVGGNEETRYAYAYTYRDYVVRAFNDDLPFDRFITEQLAADLLPLGEDNRPLAALGFLTLGRRFINNEQDIIDDRLDVICRGLMGVTIQCARCHDHKYDPVPTRDYYSLYNVMRSSREPDEKPLLAKQPRHPEYDAYLAEQAKRKATLDAYTRSNTFTVQVKIRDQVGDYLQLAYDTAKLTNEVDREKILRDRKLNKVVRDRWMTRLAVLMKTNDPVFTPLLAFNAITNEAEFPERAKELSARFAANNDPTNRLNPLVAALFTEPPAAMTNVIERYGRLLRTAHERWVTLLKLNDLAQPLHDTNGLPFLALFDADEEQLRQVQYAPDAPANPPPDRFGEFFLFDDSIKGRIDELKRNIVALDVTHAGAPPRAMALVDKPKPEEVRVFLRGNPGTPGTNAPRRFLEVASRGERPLYPTNASGRLELARDLVSRDNPLTSRVFVNRVWLHHFGAGLVRTPGDFGLRSEPPAHPELLDWLAAEFQTGGHRVLGLASGKTASASSTPDAIPNPPSPWSVKHLHRLIVLSATYQQASGENPAYALADFDNRLLWRQNRRRLDFEAMRDALLAVSRRLDATVAGRPVDIVGEPLNRRRTLYAFVDRQDLPNMFRVFDFANPDTTSPQRFQTTVPAQALFLMNSPLVIECTKQLVASTNFARLASDAERARFVYAAALQRAPSRDELASVEHFVAATPPAEVVRPEVIAWRYGRGRYDEVLQRVQWFAALPVFANNQWQVSDKFPDPAKGHMMFNATGGHTGDGGLENVLIRRWTAPRDGVVALRGELGHGTDGGDGIRARVVSSRHGELGVWLARNNRTETRVDSIEVRAGDTLDFVTDCGANTAHDTFQWSAALAWRSEWKMGDPTAWDSQKDFMDARQLPKPLTAWEKLAQVLLLSNEFAFVD
jgi:mono/diheme cytochrome c family protein